MANIKFEFNKNKDYRSVYVNGVFGGVMPRGEVMMDLFFDHVGAPGEITHQMTPDGLGPEISRDPANAPINREMMVAVLMTLDTAESIAHWLLAKVAEVKNKNQGDGDDKN